MEYTTEYNETNRICTVRITGVYQRSDDSLILREILRDGMAERSYRLFLFDLTQAEIRGEWEDAIPAITANSHEGYMRANWKAAIVYSSDLSENKLLESIASTKGQLISMFDDIDQATAWLKI